MSYENMEFVIVTLKRQHVLIKFDIKSEWICMPHEGKIKEHNMIQNAIHNKQFPLRHHQHF